MDNPVSSVPRRRPQNDAADVWDDSSQEGYSNGSPRDITRAGRAAPSRRPLSNAAPARDNLSQEEYGYGNGSSQGFSTAPSRRTQSNAGPAWDRSAEEGYGSGSGNSNASSRDSGGAGWQPRVYDAARSQPAAGTSREWSLDGGRADRRSGATSTGAWEQGRRPNPVPSPWQRGDGAAGSNAGSTAWRRGRDAGPTRHPSAQGQGRDRGNDAWRRDRDASHSPSPAPWEQGRDRGSGRPMAGNGGGGAGRLFEALEGEALYGVNPVLGALEAGRRQVYTLYVQDGAVALQLM